MKNSQILDQDLVNMGTLKAIMDGLFQVLEESGQLLVYLVEQHMLGLRLV